MHVCIWVCNLRVHVGICLCVHAWVCEHASASHTFVSGWLAQVMKILLSWLFALRLRQHLWQKKRFGRTINWILQPNYIYSRPNHSPNHNLKPSHPYFPCNGTNLNLVFFHEPLHSSPIPSCNQRCCTFMGICLTKTKQSDMERKEEGRKKKQSEKKEAICVLSFVATDTFTPPPTHSDTLTLRFKRFCMTNNFGRATFLAATVDWSGPKSQPGAGIA